MNKVTKGTLAAAAAGALLLGGAGTYALWEDSATLNAGNVSTGQLDLSTIGTTGWLYDGLTPVDDPTTPGVEAPVIVPGDELVAVYDMEVDTTGDNIQAKLALVSETSETIKLPSNIDVRYEVSTSETPDLTAGLVEGGSVTFDEVADYNFTVKVILTFSDTAEASESLPVDLSNAELVLTQF